jgi:hypothetical protein
LPWLESLPTTEGVTIGCARRCAQAIAGGQRSVKLWRVV